ncbi:MAG: hypothetical protein QM805_14595 [Pseudomonas sp.]
MKRIVIILAAAFILSLNHTYAQSKGTFTYGIGYMCFADVAFSPYYYEKDFNPNQVTQGNSSVKWYSDDTEYSRSTSVSLFTFAFQLNTKLYKINDNASISLNTAPCLRFGADEMGFLTMGMPITINYNGGVLSTFDSDKEHGFHVGLGAVIQTTPLITSLRILGGNTEYNYGIHTYLQPCIQAGYRYWGRDKRVSEICLQVGYQDFKDITTYEYRSSYYEPSGTLKNTSFSAKLMYVHYLNY